MYFHIVWCNLSFFISNFVDLILLFSLMSLAKGLSILFIFSKNQRLVLLIFTFVSFFSIYFCSDLYDFFPSTNFGFLFVLLFPVVLGVKLGCLFNVFLEVGLYCYKLPSLEQLLVHPIGFNSLCFHLSFVSRNFFYFPFDFFSNLFVI